MHVAIYTAIYGPYDWVKPIDIGVPAYLYTDSDVTAEKAAAAGWEPRVIRHGITTLNGDPAVTTPMLAHKWWKTHPSLACPDVDVSLWIDGSMEIVVSDYVDRCLTALGSDDWVAVKHPWRDCALAEGYYSAALVWRYDQVRLNAQTDHYAQWHPRDWGLFATGANVRRHHRAMDDFCDLWWQECVNWSHQDQVSLPVLLRLTPTIRWNLNMPWNEWWRLHEHGGVV